MLSSMLSGLYEAIVNFTVWLVVIFGFIGLCFYMKQKPEYDHDKNKKDDRGL